MQFDDAVDIVLAELRRENLKQSTVERYRTCLGDCAARLKARGLDDVLQVRRADIEEHQLYLQQKGYSPRTVAQCMQPLRRLFEHLGETGCLLINPMEGVVALRHHRKLPRRVVSEAEMKRLLAAPNVGLRCGIRDRALLEVLYSTAIRLGELLALEVSDVDLERGLVRIREGKGRKGRVVPLGRAAHRWTKEYLERVRPWWMRGRDHERRLWVGNRGRPFAAGNVHAMLHKYTRELGIESIYPHAIRHAAATHMLARGADIRVVQKLLGHSSIRTTQYYTRVVPTDVQATHTRTHPLEAGK